MQDALWEMISQYKDDFSRVLIFLPSRRAIRGVEKMIVENMGHAVILPNLVPLGDGVDDLDDELESWELCPICRQNQIRPGETMCKKCAEEKDYQENREDLDNDESWKEYIDEEEEEEEEDEEMLSLNKLAEEEGEFDYEEEEEEIISETEDDDFDIPDIDESDFEDDEELEENEDEMEDDEDDDL